MINSGQEYITSNKQLHLHNKSTPWNGINMTVRGYYHLLNETKKSVTIHLPHNIIRLSIFLFSCFDVIWHACAVDGTCKNKFAKAVSNVATFKTLSKYIFIQLFILFLYANDSFLFICCMPFLILAKPSKNARACYANACLCNL